MHECYNKNLTVSESIKEAKKAIADNKLTQRAKVCFGDYNTIYSHYVSYKKVNYPPLFSHGDLITFDRKFGIRNGNDLALKLRNSPNDIVSLCPPIETISSTRKVSSCFLVSSPIILKRFYDLHRAKQGFGWRCKSG